MVVVTPSGQKAVVLQTKFSPARLVAFMNNHQIMVYRLNSDNKSKENTEKTDVKRMPTCRRFAEPSRPEKPPNQIR